MEITGFLSSAPNKRVFIVQMNSGDTLQAKAIGDACIEMIINGGAAKASVQNLKDKLMAKLK